MASDGPVVLVVDDEPDVLSTIARILELIGYRVLTAESSLHAIQLIWERRDISCVVADHRMAGPSGVALLDYVAHESPQCGRILWSGVMGADIALASARHTFVEKGLTPLKLINAIAAEIKANGRQDSAQTRAAPTPR